ncbi:MAG TPA: TIGR03435 family protein [Acidobacteriaceae bacterium]|nr:TIGR03435 family protein [Acidobacteriaceae bacterium]
MTLQRALLSFALVTFVAPSLTSLAQTTGAKATPAAKPSSTQSAAAAQPSFEIADIHPSPYSFQSNYFHSNQQGTDRYLFHQASLLDLVAFAYKLDTDHVFGGPTWLDFNHYDIAAKQPASTPLDTTRLMLRRLLADRFGLVVHNDTRPTPAELLTVGKGTPKMKAAADNTVPPDCQFHPPAAPPAPDAPPPTSYTFNCRNVTMAQFVESIPRFGSSTRYVIVDQTGLKGAWDFDVTYTMLPARNGLDTANDLDKIGLKLAVGETPQPILYVDSVNENPTPNSPKLAELLPPPPPPAFEVAVIRPSPPDATGDMNIFYNPSGEVRVTHATLQRMIGEAFDISGAGIADIPDFLAKDHWDVVAKVPQDAYPRGKNGSPEIPYDDIQLMLRSLLAERFGMKAHFEDHPNDAYVLSAGSPKLKKAADPNARTSCDNMPPAGEKDPRATDPIRNRAMWCRNVTVAQFAGQLMYFALDYIKSPVLDATHIDGNYEIALNWSTSRVARGVETIDGRTINRGNAGSSSSQPEEPSGAISLPDAISKQLGLKLEMQKRNIPMLVLDHIERNPTEN